MFKNKKKTRYNWKKIFLAVFTVGFYFLVTYGVCKKRKYCNRVSEKKNPLLLTNVHVLYVLEEKTSKKKYFCLFVCLAVCLSGCLAVRTWIFPTGQNVSAKETKA